MLDELRNPDAVVIRDRSASQQPHLRDRLPDRSLLSRPAMNVAADLSILSLVTQATLIVQLVMVLLVLISLASWTSIFSKGMAIRRARNETEGFERKFWGGADLGVLHQAASNPRHKTGSRRWLPRLMLVGVISQLPKACLKYGSTNHERVASVPIK